MGRTSKGLGTGRRRPSILNGLVAYWQLDENSGTRANIVRPNSFTLTDNATVTSSTTTVDGKTARSGSFARATTEFLSQARAGIGALSPTNGAFSVSAWVQLASSLTNLEQRVITGVWNATGSNREWRLYAFRSANDNFIFLCSPDGTTSGVATATATVAAAGAMATNTWFHVVGVWDPVKNFNGVYVNGLIGGVDVKGTNAGIQGNAQFGIGADVNDSGVGTNTWNGLIAHVAYWNRTLTPREVLYLYNNNRTWPFRTPQMRA